MGSQGRCCWVPWPRATEPRAGPAPGSGTRPGCPCHRQHTALPGLRGQQRGSGECEGVQPSTSERTALGHDGEPLETQLGTPLGHGTLVWGQAKQDTPVLWAETHPALNTSGLCLEHSWEQGEEESCSWLVDRGQFSCFRGRLELLPFLLTNTEMQ